MQKKIILLSCRYCAWFVVFFKTIVHSHKGAFFFYATLGVIKEFSGVIAFFIPIKVIMILSNPSILDLYFSIIGKITIRELFYYAGLVFLVLMFVSMICSLLLSVLVHRKSHDLWLTKSDEFSSRTKYKNIYFLMLDSVTHIIIILLGLMCIIFLDAYLFMPILIALISFILISIVLSKYTKNHLLSKPSMDPKFMFKLVSDVGFALVFLFIVIEYYSNTSMNFLFTVLAVFLSRIVLRNMQQLFVKHRRLFDDHYSQTLVVN